MSTPPATPSWTRQDGGSHPTVQACIALLHERFDPERASSLESTARLFFERAAWQYLDAHPPEQLVALVEDVDALLGGKVAHDVRVRVFTPDPDRGWARDRTVVLATVSDRPFLFDSLQEYLIANDCRIYASLHPVLGISRNNGTVDTLRAAESREREAVVFFEIGLVTDERCEELTVGIEHVLSHVIPATEDYQALRERAASLAELLGQAADDEEALEAAAFLIWLFDHHFVCLGYREYDVVGKPVPSLVARAGSGLGILRSDEASSVATPTPLDDLPQELRALVMEGPLLTIAKTNDTSLVHRRHVMDYIGIKKRDEEGRVVGECRFIGLYTASALGSHAATIPIVRRKLQVLLDRTGLPPGSHDYKMLEDTFEGLPKDDLFQSSVDELQATIDAIISTDPRHVVRVLIRQDLRATGLSIMVIMPRDRFNGPVREDVQALLVNRIGGYVTDYRLVLSEGASARLHFYLRTDTRAVDVARASLEQEIAEVIQAWDDRLEEILLQSSEPTSVAQLMSQWRHAFPDSYQARVVPVEAVIDLPCMQRAYETNDAQVAIHPARNGESHTRIKIYRPGRQLILSEVLPILESLGLFVLDEVPAEIRGADGFRLYLHDFGVIVAESGQPLDEGGDTARIGEAILRVLNNQMQIGPLNALVVHANLSWREVELFRTYIAYYQQLGGTFTRAYVSQVLVRNSEIVRSLLAYFTAKFSPETGHDSYKREAGRLPALRRTVAEQIDGVESLDDDRVLRSVFNLLECTLRTNYYRTDGERRMIAIKIRSSAVEQMPLPRPLCEIFVQGPDVEGIHLRGGEVARGGLRWSDRIEDYRTEVLGLMKAQMTKNAVIVPAGAKGGFIMRRPLADPGARAEQLVELYSVFISGLLDVTDNIVDGAVVHPPEVVVYDGEDPYLVVAADKGTAHLSDTANAVSERYGFWLGDAFASGGSAGYDHKKLGITARGAWESAKRHFRELGKDIQTEPFTCVGIGDMGGDVFGNGMLNSRATKLVAAFNHLHIFLDPNPDPEKAWSERKRLFDLPRSSWGDYDTALISTGGGVFERAAKRIGLSPEVQEALGLEVDAMSGPELVHAILCAPVELLYNGGIGTYIKAANETHLEVGDKANDAVRVNAPAVRAAVVVEGGNLGITQQGRIALALRGVRVNADMIDNSAGVDCSDHEVNLKILLGRAEAEGTLTREERNTLLEAMADQVSQAVLQDNYLQAILLSKDQIYSASHPRRFSVLLDILDAEADLDRTTEYLPSNEELIARGAEGQGLTRPELAVMVGYTKNWLHDEIRHSPLVEDSSLTQLAIQYFPPQVRRPYAEAIKGHRLRKELIATVVANDVVNQAGLTYTTRTCEYADCTPVEAIWAYIVADEIFGAHELRNDIYALDGQIPTSTQYRALGSLENVLSGAARWLLKNVSPLTPISVLRTRFRERFELAVDPLLELYVELEDTDIEAERKAYREEGLTEHIADYFVLLPVLRNILDVLLISETTGASCNDVASVYMRVHHMLRLQWLEQLAQGLVMVSHWERLALDSARDDLVSHARRIVTVILSRRRADESPMAALKRYWDDQSRAINRHFGMIGQIVEPSQMTLAALNVINRTLKAI